MGIGATPFKIATVNWNCDSADEKFNGRCESSLNAFFQHEIPRSRTPQSIYMRTYGVTPKAIFYIALYGAHFLSCIFRSTAISSSSTGAFIRRIGHASDIWLFSFLKEARPTTSCDMSGQGRNSVAANYEIGASQKLREH